MTVIVDAVQRERAIDPAGSFCVSAPAGSGKTELLIQRYLALLARVQRPEQVLAITFTRKAAAEMRERVMAALQDAELAGPVESRHEQRTRDLALAALESDQRYGWQLLRDVSRLSIKTIDSFCLSLTRQMPILSLFGGQATPVDDAAALYEEAVAELFLMLEMDHAVTPALRALLSHFDNDWGRVRALLVGMLGRRNQWAMYVGVHEDPEASERYLVGTVQDLVRDELRSLAQSLAPYESELLDLMRYAAGNLGQPLPQQLPSPGPDGLADWRAVRAFLLTASKPQWRKTVNKNNGFPPASTGEDAAQKIARFKQLVAELSSIEGVEEALVALEVLPEVRPGEQAWQLVLHLSRLLPVLAAQLLLVFRRRGSVDHTQVAQSALVALGEDEAPTDLALRLDYRIEHMLVDEFQDTSINQFELIRKLTRGWSEHNEANPRNPRTLMVVGDAMQSIYGFRDANVGLFLKARDEGFNGLALESLELQCNFRSEAGVIDWVNKTFAPAFPLQDDIVAGHVKYRPAVAVRPAAKTAAISLHGFVGDAAREAEVDFICDSIARQVAQGARDIAVLGRQRSHLQTISAQLKILGVPFQAQELDSLAAAPAVVDLLNLCRALANDADRVAWLALLRAPWCGLGLADLLHVARFGDNSPLQPLRQVIGCNDLHAQLSDDGGQRLRHVSAALTIASAKRDRLSLRAWVELVWTNLGGPAAAASDIALADAESFLRLLEQADAEGLGLDVHWLQSRVDRQFMSGGDAGCPVQLLTLHKAKGLEFERVYIPRLNGTGRDSDRDLLLWDEHSNERGDRAFLLAADDRSPPGTPSLYNYLRASRKKKAQHEATRLMYVGATRAARHLHLSAGINWDVKKDAPKAPPAASLLHTIWPTFAEAMQVHNAELVMTHQPAVKAIHRLELASLPVDYYRVAALPEGNIPDRADNYVERAIGTVVHLALEELSALAELPWTVADAELARWRVALQREGLWGDTLEQAMDKVQQSITVTLQDAEGGRWVLDPGHRDARSEWPLTLVEDGVPGDIVIDRTFVDRERAERWIIDYKSSEPLPDENRADFLRREGDHYRGQLLRYRTALRELGQQPVRCALYFTSLGQLYELEDLRTP